MLAYLVIREGTKWSDVFRLTPGQSVTMGRAPTNEIVIHEDLCSRRHAQIFEEQGHWNVRDLESRNGTRVGGELIDGVHPLQPGDVIRIGRTQLAFVNDLSRAYSESSPAAYSLSEGETVLDAGGASFSDSNVLDTFEPTTITHRRVESKFLKPPHDDESAIPKAGRASIELYQLAVKLATQPDVASVAKLALDALIERTQADAGAILLMSRSPDASEHVEDLELVASRTDLKPSYQRVSAFLASTVLREGEGVLARNIEGDSTLGPRDSKGEFHATSVICAPVRSEGEEPVGLVHLYSSDSERVLDPEDLEFSLAAATSVGHRLQDLDRQKALAEDLSITKSENDQLRRRLGVESEIVGRSPQMEKVHEEIARAAPSRLTVLIRGESGVGKELVARAVHFSSPRKKNPFVCLNCAALTESLLESELFGHERGAFTGATERKLGKFEAADHGTLMLDEIGEMSPAIQAKFLRVLEGHPFERVGGSKPVSVDVRVIAATNRDLERAVKEAKFRRDLFFRLHGFEIVVPPLRRRPEDIITLAEYFVRRFAAETGRKIRGFTQESMQQMRAYHWPGNVRELKNVIEHAVLLAQEDFIRPDHITFISMPTASESNVLSQPRNVYEPMTLADVEKRHIADTLSHTSWNKSRTASILGIERSTLDRKIRRYNLVDPRQPPRN